MCAVTEVSHSIFKKKQTLKPSKIECPWFGAGDAAQSLLNLLMQVKLFYSICTQAILWDTKNVCRWQTDVFTYPLFSIPLQVNDSEHVGEGNASHYLYWAATGPSCTGTRHRTPAVWQTRYRSSAFARTGRSWRATSYALWKEGEENSEIYRSGWELSYSSCYSSLNKMLQRGRNYDGAEGNQTEMGSDGFLHLTSTNPQPICLSTSRINRAYSADTACSPGFRAVCLFWPTVALLAMTFSPFVSIFTPLWIYRSIGSNSSRLRPTFLRISNKEDEPFAGCPPGKSLVVQHSKVKNLPQSISAAM